MRKHLTALLAALAAIAGIITAGAPQAAAYTTIAQATVNVNMRTCASTSCSSVGTLQGGQYFYIDCYRVGQSINGDAIWYQGKTNPNNTWSADVAGYYLTTGHDPSPYTGPCR